MDWSRGQQGVRKRSCRTSVECESSDDVSKGSTAVNVNSTPDSVVPRGNTDTFPRPLPENEEDSRSIVLSKSMKKEADSLPVTDLSDSTVLPVKRPKRIDLEAEYRASGIAGFPSLTPRSEELDLSVKSVEGEGYSRRLSCKSPLDDGLVTVWLKGLWVETTVTDGSSIRLIQPKKIGEKEFVVDSDNGLLVLESDVLVSCTAVVQGLFCPRKAVLSDRFRGGNCANKAMLIGNIVHSLFQSAVRLSSGKVTREWLLEQWRGQCTSAVIQQLVALDMNQTQMEDELSAYMDEIVEWTCKHMPPPLGRNEPLSTGSRIEGVADIEENVWDHRIGIKGKVDVTLRVRTKTGKDLTEPLELKTGKSKLSVEHSGQVLLYCMALSSRMPNMGTIGDGVLLYLKDGVSRAVVPKLNELKGVISLRNDAAAFIASLSERSFPAPLSDTRSCKWCEHATVCCALQRTVESSLPVSSSMSQMQSTLTAHLTEKHLEYFRKWITWIFMEWNCAKSLKADVRDIWRLDCKRREEMGRCLTDLCADVDVENDDCKLVKFTRRSGSPIQSTFEKGDMVIVSSDSTLAFAMGPVHSVDAKSIVVYLSSGSQQLKSGRSFLLDRYDSLSTYATNLSNVALLMQPADHFAKVRSLLIDMESPKFSRIAKDEVNAIAGLIRHLNRAQAHAVVKALLADDFLLIQGLPGSGKTSTIAVLVRCFILLGRSVLITSYTHSAVDNLLLKLIQDVETKDILRLGDSRSVREELRPLTLDAKLAQVTGTNAFECAERILKHTPIVACTCLAVATNTLFSHRRFSICLVDEASLVLESALIPPLLVSDSFVLVGDSLQLSPLVQSKPAREEGMAISLFERLKVHSSAVITLNSQYRMNRSIAKLSSEVFYDGQLKCANDNVAEGCLDGTTLENVDETPLSGHLQLIASSSVDDAVVFIDTKSLENPAYQMQFGTSPGAVFNDGEIGIVSALCKLYVKLGVSKKDIGVISVYRHHADRLRKLIDENIEPVKLVLLPKRWTAFSNKVPSVSVINNRWQYSCKLQPVTVLSVSIAGAGVVQVNTVDQYQGRDKRVVVVSLVWTQREGARRSELLSDARRINVAITRAKHKLILVGCKQSMLSYKTMAALIDLIPATKSVELTPKECANGKECDWRELLT